MNANGRNRKARKTAMAAPYGDWEPFSADPRMLGCVELRVVSSSWRFPPPLSLKARARSEERRVGKECRCRRSPGREKKIGACRGLRCEWMNRLHFTIS